KPLAPLVPQLPLENARRLKLGNPGSKLRQRALQREDRELGGAAYRLHLSVVLYLPKPFHHIRRRAPLPPLPLLQQPLEVPVHEDSALETDSGDPRHGRERGPEPAPETLRLDRHTGEVADLVRNLSLVPEVGQEQGVIRGNEQQRAGSRKPRKVPHVRQARDKQRIQTRPVERVPQRSQARRTAITHSRDTAWPPALEAQVRSQVDQTPPQRPWPRKRASSDAARPRARGYSSGGLPQTG